MKKLILVGLLALGLVGLSEAAVISTNIANGTPVLLTTNRASIYAISLTSDKAVNVEFFNIGTLAAPYYGTNRVNSAFVSRTTYPTNFVSSYVGQTGFTNWYTNAGSWTLLVTNAAATNALSPGFAAPVGANTYATYPVDLLFERGIVVRATTNVSVDILYRSGN